MKQLVKKALRLPAKAILASGYDVIQEYIATSPAVWFNPYLSAKVRPYRPGVETYIIRRDDVARPVTTGGDGSSLPIPPKEWFLYGGSEEGFIASGKANAGTIRRVAEASGFSFQTARRILDFGCADGRIIRWFHDLKDCEVWGVDLLGEYILLCQQYLSPPFKFATNTSEPHLPFEDRSFDLIYACSVFTHIADLADAWLLELRRILRPGGRLFITVHDDRSIEMCLDPETIRRYPHLAPVRDILLDLERQNPFVGTNYSMFTVFRSPGSGRHREAQVFYKTDYLKEHLASMFNVHSITLEAYSEFQSAYLLEMPLIQLEHRTPDVGVENGFRVIPGTHQRVFSSE
jgi:SAM-dependent methyltransferase